MFSYNPFSGTSPGKRKLKNERQMNIWKNDKFHCNSLAMLGIQASSSDTVTATKYSFALLLPISIQRINPTRSFQ
ncbi:hypothetical protein ABKN59_011631 [Abortiporus biennis]